MARIPPALAGQQQLLQLGDVMNATADVTTEQLSAVFLTILASPKREGTLALIVRRPATNERQTPGEAQLDVVEGLMGDNWKVRGSARTSDGSAHPDMQLNVMNARMVAALGPRDRWPLAGDQLYLDLDLSTENLPPGTRLAIGGATIEVTAIPHLGCKKFQARFGADALAFINAPERRHLRLRGLNAKVIESGTIRVGDVARKV